MEKYTMLDLEFQIAQSNDVARCARTAIKKEIARRNESGAEFDAGFACGLSFALGAFSGVCEDEPTKKGAGK